MVDVFGLRPFPMNMHGSAIEPRKRNFKTRKKGSKANKYANDIKYLMGALSIRHTIAVYLITRLKFCKASTKHRVSVRTVHTLIFNSIYLFGALICVSAGRISLYFHLVWGN